QKLAKLLSSQPSFCFDTETTGLDALLADIVGMSFSFEKGKAYYVPTSSNYEDALETVAIFKSVLENTAIEKVGQNIKYDILLLSKYNVQVKGPLFDTMVAHYLIDPDTRHNMDILAASYLGYKPMSTTERIGPKGKTQRKMRDVEIGLVKEYAAGDADITWQLHEVFKPLLEETQTYRLAREGAFPLIYVLAEIEK